MNPIPHFRHTLSFAALAALAVLGSPPAVEAITQQSAESADAGTLVSQEEAFARAARERGTRAAFLEFLADDGVVFRPGPVTGRAYWQAAAEDPNVLQWYPSRAAISSSGDLGYTIGPWTSGKRGARPRAFGHYVTVWRREANGEWRAAADGGISHPKRSRAPRLIPGAVMHEPNGLRRTRLDVQGLEQRFASTARASGYEATAAAWAIERSVRMRDGFEPSALASTAEGIPAQVVVEGSDLSAAADLAYTYGTVSEDGGGRAAFLHVWRVIDGEPYLAVDLLTRLPDEKG
ncbi:MAG TPA: nuclear transport factor 2 family protein [Steroidobacteraceae bacterium]|nr:nuclear transport factor 2 family protein [Steroidobacteraceae bacterium]